MFSIVFFVESWYNNITTQIEYVLHIMGEVYVFSFFGKNVCSASYALPFYARLRFNLCGSNGSCVFRCAAVVAHFLFTKKEILQNGKQKSGSFLADLLSRLDRKHHHQSHRSEAPRLHFENGCIFLPHHHHFRYLRTGCFHLQSDL